MPDSTSPTSPAAPAANPPELSFDTVLTVISSSTRWRILRELIDGPKMNSELAASCDCTPNAVSKHTAVLIAAGVVINPRGRLFEIPERFVADKSQRLLDLGYCTLRLDTTP